MVEFLPERNVAKANVAAVPSQTMAAVSIHPSENVQYPYPRSMFRSVLLESYSVRVRLSMGFIEIDATILPNGRKTVSGCIFQRLSLDCGWPGIKK
jgi:hypothetical protein